MKTAYALTAGFWAWLIYTKPAEMAIIAKATGHVFVQAGSAAWLAVLLLAGISVIGWLALIFTKGIK